MMHARSVPLVLALWAVGSACSSRPTHEPTEADASSPDVGAEVGPTDMAVPDLGADLSTVDAGGFDLSGDAEIPDGHVDDVGVSRTDGGTPDSASDASSTDSGPTDPDGGASDGGVGGSCAAAGDACGAHAHCRNTWMALACVCDRGFMAGPAGCVDVDECARPSFPCEEGSCTNIEGSFVCTPPGGTPCAAGMFSIAAGCYFPDACDTQAFYPACYFQLSTCYNVVGGFGCLCPSGFVDDGHEGCIPVDECTSNVCDPTGVLDGEVCVDAYWRYTCQCPAGTTFDGSTCSP